MNKKILITIGILVLIGVLGTFLTILKLSTRPAPLCPSFLGREGIPSMPNPASVYCNSLGYNLKDDYCLFPDGSKRNQWEFFSGKCGQKFSYCERYGKGKIDVVRESCAYSSECAVCILPDGTHCFDWDYCSGKCP
jgi:putative hemolysin